MRALHRLLIALLLTLALPLQALAVAGALPCAMHGGQAAGTAHAIPDTAAAEAPCHEPAAGGIAADQGSPCSLCKLCTAVSALPATPVALATTQAVADLAAPPPMTATTPRPERLERPPRSALPT